MIGTAIVFDALPWWIATPVFYVVVLVTGVALDVTYVDRTTVLTGALAVSVHSLVSGGLWLPVSLYLDVGLVVGVYGLYAYVIDGYVADWFRLLAFFVYSPLSVLLVIALPDVLVVVALAIAAYLHLQLLATLHPVEPYYFGPESETEFVETAAETPDPEPIERDGPTAGSSIAGHFGTPRVRSHDSGVENVPERRSTTSRRATEPQSSDGGQTDRGILPRFMRRLCGHHSGTHPMGTVRHRFLLPQNLLLSREKAHVQWQTNQNFASSLPRRSKAQTTRFRVRWTSFPRCRTGPRPSSNRGISP